VNLIDAVVVLTGLALVAGELWYFLGPRRTEPQASVADDGVQEVQVLVKSGYHPDVIPVEAGRPVRLVFYRDETADCSAQVVFEGLDIDRELPPFRKTAIEFTPYDPGDYHFRCGMSVIRGRVVAEVGRENARSNLGKGHTKHG
jgi:plastocyanin domain-containing protein